MPSIHTDVNAAGTLSYKITNRSGPALTILTFNERREVGVVRELDLDRT